MRFDRNSQASKTILTEVNTFKILPEEEQRALLREFKTTGNRTCVDKVLKSNMKYFIGAIMRISKGRITTSHPLFLEILQDSLLNIFRVICGSYDPDKSCIRLYANLPIRTAVNKYMSKIKKRSLQIKRDPAEKEEYSSFNGLDITLDMHSVTEAKDLKAFHDYYIEHKTLKEAGDEQGISVYKAKQRAATARNKIRETLKD